MDELKREYRETLAGLGDAGVIARLEPNHDGLGLFEVRVNRADGFYVLNDGSWIRRRVGGAGPDARAMARVFLGERAEAVRRHARDGVTRLSVLDALQACGHTDAYAVLSFRRGRGGGWDVEYADARRMPHRARIPHRDIARVRDGWADRLERRGGGLAPR